MVSTAAICGSETTPKREPSLVCPRGTAAAVIAAWGHRERGLITGSISPSRAVTAMGAVYGGQAAVSRQMPVTPACRRVSLKLSIGRGRAFMASVTANYEATAGHRGMAYTSHDHLGICTGRMRCFSARDLGYTARRGDRSKILASNGGDIFSTLITSRPSHGPFISQLIVYNTKTLSTRFFLYLTIVLSPLALSVVSEHE